MARAVRQRNDWYVSAAVYAQYEECLAQLGEVEEFTDEFHALVDRIQSLPGFPQDIDPDIGHVIPHVTTVTPTTVVH